MTLTAHEHPLKKVFSSDFDFRIPRYQRPYAWGTEQALQLLEDLDAAVARPIDEPYFLGSLVLIQANPGSPTMDVIDGQQRLTTLTILLAVLRDLSSVDQTKTSLATMVLEPGEPLDGIQPRPRLRLREQDVEFFAKWVQAPGNTQELSALADYAVPSDSQRAVRDNAAALRSALLSRDEDERASLAALIRNRTYLVVVTTPTQASAHRIFSVMNDRGLDLEPSDIFKADVIGSIAANAQDAYAKKWESAEQSLTRPVFAALFLHLRVIVAKARAMRELLIEFPEQVLEPYLRTGRATEFVDDLLIPYADSFAVLNERRFGNDPRWASVSDLLLQLSRIDNNDWQPPALLALRQWGDDPGVLAQFLKRLDRLAASMLLRREYTTPRVLRYIQLLRELEAGQGVNAAALDLSENEKAATRRQIDGDIYHTTAIRKYLLLRVDSLIADNPGATYDHKVITVEHVLPQNPPPGSTWLSDFTDEQRERWTHRLGNLLLLNRRKNSEAQNFDFEVKKARYFTSRNGAAIFALTTQVLQHDVWTPDVVAQRHVALTSRLFAEWELV